MPDQYFYSDYNTLFPPNGSYSVLEKDLTLPVIPLETEVLFPKNSFPLGNLDGLSAASLRKARQGSLRLCVMTVGKDGSGEKNPGYTSKIGVEARVESFLSMPTGGTGAVLVGVSRLVVKKLWRRRYGYEALVDILEEIPIKRNKKNLSLIRQLEKKTARLLKEDNKIGQEVRSRLSSSHDATSILDLIIPYLSLSTEEKLLCLSDFNCHGRIKRVMGFIDRELDLIRFSYEIHDKVKGDFYEEHRRNYLREQIQAIKRELGDMEEGEQNLSDELKKSFKELDLPKSVVSVVEEELDRLTITPTGTPEYIVSHSYLSLVRELPFRSEEPKAPKIEEAIRTLNRFHYGLNLAKDRIIEYIALIKHCKGELPGQILLLNGPPGVGKTSLARSIAASLGRPFARISLGGIKDEAEIRGHRRTYIAAMPGKIISALRQTESAYSVILLDEIDKIGGEKQGDIGAALLEVLDREQNREFVDHYLGFPFDLSNIIFIATSNDHQQIAEPLLDRMELIDIPSYTDTEKLKIARGHIIPAIRKEMKLVASKFHVSDKVIRNINRGYTREAGVRQLKRELTSLGRKVVRRLVESRGQASSRITPENLPSWLGAPKYIDEPRDKILPPGVSIGLAYTSVGGEILYIETSRSQSTLAGGSLKLTGSIGKVMQESAEAVFSFLLANPEEFGLKHDDVRSYNFHLHLPDGATPKDGPSAGLAIMSAIVGCLTNKPLPVNIAMTGEISLRGQVLPVGGIREKFLAALRYGKKKIIYPAANEHDLLDVPAEIIEKLELVPVHTMKEALCKVGLL
ncbi:MAG: endopeptidase La [Oligoflexales bacterium]|nr:endopeptidase La [Oligoflexales bacterium]